MTNSISILKDTQETSVKYSSMYSPPLPHTYTTQVPPIPTYSLSHYMYLAQPPLTSTYSSLFLNNDSLPQITNASVLKVVPDLKEFLEGLDVTYGNGKYTQYLEVFEKHDIRVSLIPKISDEWWEKKLQITSLGHISTLKDEANKYV